MSPTKGVILVSEAFTEINAGLVIILASGHESPIAKADLADSNRDPDEIAALVVRAYHEHVEGYLATTRPPTTRKRPCLVTHLAHHYLAPGREQLLIGAMHGAY